MRGQEREGVKEKGSMKEKKENVLERIRRLKK